MGSRVPPRSHRRRSRRRPRRPSTVDFRTFAAVCECRRSRKHCVVPSGMNLSLHPAIWKNASRSARRASRRSTLSTRARASHMVKSQRAVADMYPARQRAPHAFGCARHGDSWRLQSSHWPPRDLAALLDRPSPFPRPLGVRTGCMRQQSVI